MLFFIGSGVWYILDGSVFEAGAQKIISEKTTIENKKPDNLIWVANALRDKKVVQSSLFSVPEKILA